MFGREIPEWLEINHMLVLCRPVWLLGFELVERLPRFVLDSEPVGRSWFWNRIKTVFVGRKCALEDRRQSVQITNRITNRFLVRGVKANAIEGSNKTISTILIKILAMRTKSP